MRPWPHGRKDVHLRRRQGKRKIAGQAGNDGTARTTGLPVKPVKDGNDRIAGQAGNDESDESETSSPTRSGI